MDSLLDVNPGAIIWTIINFCIFLFIILKFGAKPIIKGLKAREDKIINEIADAVTANEEARKLFAEAQEKINSSQKEMAEIIAKGRRQAEEQLKIAAEEAEKNKQSKIKEAVREIERSKEAAIKKIRTEVASLVVEATEKILDEKLDKEKHYKLVESYIDKLPEN